MASRDDYPTGYDGTITWTQYEAMCDEIDLLRAELAEAVACLQPPEQTVDGL